MVTAPNLTYRNQLLSPKNHANMISPLLGAHRSYSISLPGDSPLKCVPTTLHARKNSEYQK